MIRTVLGDIQPELVLSANYHEHLFQVSPLLPGDDLDDAQRSQEEAKLLTSAGTSLMVEATPTGLGARPRDVAAISSATGLDIVHVTGLHHGGHYAEDHPLRTTSEGTLASQFTADILGGFRRSGETVTYADRPVRAGMIKAGIRYWSIGPFEQKAIRAISAAHRASGAPVMIHLDYGSAAHEVLDILAAEGVAASSVVLAHMDRNLDPGLHLDLIARGAYLGYDGWARHREAPDSAIIDCLYQVCGGNGAAGVVLGGDVARSSRYLSYGGIPGLPYIEERVVPRLIAELGEECTALLLRENPARLLSFTPPR
ncbi:MAG: phosphotriesterase family protein [Leucobacter sp.]